MKVLRSARNEDYMVFLVRLENGSYAVPTKDIGAFEFNSFFRSFKTIESAEKHFNMLK